MCEGAEPSACCCSHFLGSRPAHAVLHLYRSLVRSNLDYGSVFCGSTRESYLRTLDPIQNHALRLCLGAFRTSPASSMCVQTNEPPLYIRRRMLSIQCNVCNLRRIAAMGLYTLMLEQPISVFDIAPLTCSRRTYGSIDLTVVENSYTSLCTLPTFTALLMLVGLCIVCKNPP